MFTMLMCAFFFQAEDGIRDGHVTGVQTCALPICAVQLGSAFAVTRECDAHDNFKKVMAEATADDIVTFNSVRSEERRVGKECRSRWAAERCETNETDSVRGIGDRGSTATRKTSDY